MGFRVLKGFGARGRLFKCVVSRTAHRKPLFVSCVFACCERDWYSSDSEQIWNTWDMNKEVLQVLNSKLC